MSESHVQVYYFEATIQLIGINPYVPVPEHILQDLFDQAKRNKSPIPIKGTVNGRPYTQSLVKYKGEWRLYINTLMIKNSPKHIGEQIQLSICFNSVPPKFISPEVFSDALDANPKAKEVFHKMPPYLQKEINRYLSNLKSQASLDLNIDRAIKFLMGKGKFIGREKP
ncbi:DUF1905 domain-containing protein [Sphingobacterium shayense]|uniref:DUF1905 domain-containing protein n=1 Tax=Sphingobacterium shayense TaxID=626343 RepID=UPI0015555406|nr:DUF1905 domain-containing protein [Sphingobacterium shayense]NQD69596.1 DUF1905 domain-containing protein [Sphingobacterium shayense]